MPDSFLKVLMSIRSRLNNGHSVSTEDFMRLQAQILSDKMIVDGVQPLAVPIIVDTLAKLAIATTPDALESFLKSKKERHSYLLAACGIRVASRECRDTMQSLSLLKLIEGVQFAQDDEREPLRRILCKHRGDQAQGVLAERAASHIRLRPTDELITESRINYILQVNASAVEFIALCVAIPCDKVSIEKIWRVINSEYSDTENAFGRSYAAGLVSVHIRDVIVGLTLSVSDTLCLRAMKRTLLSQFIGGGTSRLEVSSLGEEARVHFALCELYLCDDKDIPELLRRIADIGTNVSDESDLPAYFGYSPTPTHFLASVVVRPSVVDELLDCFRSNDSARIHAGIALTFLFGPSLTLCDSRLVGSLGDVLKSAELPQPLSREDILDIISLQTHE